MDLKDVAEKIMNDDIEELKESLDVINTLNDNSIEISLEEFETYLLKYIIRSIEINDETSTVFKHNYLYMTNNKYRTPIYVIDNTGSVVYKLPPLILDLDFNETSKINFSKIISMYTNTVGSNSRYADKILNKNLNTASSVLNYDKDTYEFYINEVRKIYSDYNHLLTGDKKVDKDIKEETIEDDFLEY